MANDLTSAQLRFLVLLGLTNLAGTLSIRVTDPFIAALAAEFVTGPDRTALLATAFAVPFAFVQPFLGPVGDALGKRRIIRLALFLVACFALLAPFAGSLNQLMALRALTGMAAGGIMPLSIAAVGDAFPLGQRQVALSKLVAFGIAGQVGGGALAGLLAGTLGWRGVLALCGAVALLASLLLCFISMGGPLEQRQRFESLGALRRYRAILKLPAARLLYASVLIEGVLIFGIFPWLAPMLQERGIGGNGAAIVEAGLTVAAFGAGGFVYAAIVKALLGRLGQSRMVFLGGGVAALALLGLALAPNRELFIALGLALGVGFYMIHNTIQTRVTEVAPEARGSAVALHAFHFYVGHSIGPVVIGLAIAWIGGSGAFALAGIGILLLALKLGATR
jgi:MFS transporter, DHA1 family, inner membrane transport protein